MEEALAKRRRVEDDPILRELLSSSVTSKKLSYGTAGFRDHHSLLQGAMVRVGLLAALRSKNCAGDFVGVMVTASHNPEPDNGAKIVDSDGGMLAQSWEPHAENLVNAGETEDVFRILRTVEDLSKTEICRVVIGRDTRPHSQSLVGMAKKGAEFFGANVYDLGQVTTPQLHFVVMQLNSNSELGSKPPEHLLDTYYDTLAGGFLALIGTSDKQAHFKIILDGSNGIGSVQVGPLIEAINSKQPNTIEVDLRNRSGDGPVNDGCGAEMVQKMQTPPATMDPVSDSGKVAASFDGDADRIVFHGFTTLEKWRLVDGDKIAALIAVFLTTELSVCPWASDFSFGLVQTAYANGASTAFLRSKGVKIVFAKTGVKYLHEKAHHFDCGIYFEANGHGTVLFSNALQNKINIELQSVDSLPPRTAEAVKRLHVFINQHK